jgi:hypothetical protein
MAVGQRRQIPVSSGVQGCRIRICRYYSLAPMIRTALLLVRDVRHFVALACSSHSRLAAENLLLRKLLAFCVERKVKPRRLNDTARIALVILARAIDRRELLVVVCGRTRSSDGTGRDSACSGGGSHDAGAVPGFLCTSGS